MPWCPNCKDEYREGITVCADCGAQLVDNLSLVETKIEDPNCIGEIDDSNIGEDFILELDEEETPETQINPSLGVYVNNSEKAEENRSSAYVLLVIGVAGLVGIVLFALDVFPNNINIFGKYVISGVLGALFVLFTIMGVVSLRNFKIYKKKAYKENNLTEQIKKWCLENLDAETIDKNFETDNVSAELKYFPRFAILKNSISNQFMNLDESYLERLTEEIYPDIFEKDEE